MIVNLNTGLKIGFPFKDDEEMLTHHLTTEFRDLTFTFASLSINFRLNRGKQCTFWLQTPAYLYQGVESTLGW